MHADRPIYTFNFKVRQRVIVNKKAKEELHCIENEERKLILRKICKHSIIPVCVGIRKGFSVRDIIMTDRALYLERVIFNDDDIGANLTDEMYQGSYHGSKKHEPDLDKVLNRSWAGGMDKLIITGGSLIDSKKSIELSNIDSRLFSTVGCHPTRCSDFLSDPDNYLNELRSLILENNNKVVAIGECGLDYERLHFCEKEVQMKYFEFQLQLSSEFQLPLFLHCRGAANDLVKILTRNRHHIYGGVVHSFDGTQDELDNILKLDLYIGINGCSLRTKENLEVATRIPQDRLMIETDSPWCEVKPTHPGYQHVATKYSSVKKEKYSVESDHQVKGRNEPVNIVQVLEILAAIRNENIDQLAEAIYNNTCKLFFKNKLK